MKTRRGLTLIAITLILSGSFIVVGCDNKSEKGQAPANPPLPVDVVTMKQEPLSIKTELVGRTSAFRIAEIRPQVSGIILKRLFTEGTQVTQGQSLYKIDPATYQAAVEAAKGELAKAEATAQINNLTVRRYKSLLGTHYISKQDYDTALANASQANAMVQAAKASLESAKINLDYTDVSSPITGRIGKSSVTEGALINANQAAALTTVQQLDPIYVDLTQSSTDYLKLKQEITSGEIKQNNGKTDVSLLLEDGSKYPLKGTLTFSDVTVDKSTGSITLRAIFSNPENILLPGMFVRAQLDEGVKPSAMLIPQQAIIRTPRGDAGTYIVSDDSIAQFVPLKLGRTIGDKWEVLNGLKPGDRVIVSGLVMMRPGTFVHPLEQGASENKGSGNEEQQKNNHE